MRLYRLRNVRLAVLETSNQRRAIHNVENGYERVALAIVTIVSLRSIGAKWNGRMIGDWSDILWTNSSPVLSLCCCLFWQVLLAPSMVVLKMVSQYDLPWTPFTNLYVSVRQPPLWWFYLCMAEFVFLFKFWLVPHVKCIFCIAIFSLLLPHLGKTRV